jgi:hypothetical protein
MKSNMKPTKHTTKERLVGIGEQAALSFIINSSHYTMMEREEGRILDFM